MNLETKITIYKFTPQVFTLTRIYLFPVILQQMLSEMSDIAFKSN